VGEPDCYKRWGLVLKWRTIAVLTVLGLSQFFTGCAGLLTEMTTQLDINPLALQRGLATPIPENVKLEARQVDQQILSQYRLVNDPATMNRLEKIVGSLVRVSHKRDLHPAIRVLDSKDINAFVAGGEYVYVYKGLLEAVTSDDELACILGHELAHVDAGHMRRTQLSQLWTQLGLMVASGLAKGKTADQVIQTAAAYLPNAYSREHEREADILGTIYAHRAGYDTTRFADFFKRTWGQEEAARVQLATNLQQVYSNMVNVGNTYQIYNQAYQAYRTPQAYTNAVNAYNAYLQAQQEFEVATVQYNSFVANTSPLFRTHPVDSERIATVLGVSEYLRGQRPLASLNESSTIQKVVETLGRVEAREAAQPHFQQALAYRQQGLISKAVEEYQKAVTADPEFAEALINLAAIHGTQGLDDQAIREYERALALNPNVFEVQESIGRLYAKRGRVEEAISALKKASRLHHPDIHLTLAALYHKRGQVDEAIGEYKKALALKPQDAKTLSELGACYLEKGKPGEARKAFQRSLAIDPNLQEARSGLAQLEAVGNANSSGKKSR